MSKCCALFRLKQSCDVCKSVAADTITPFGLDLASGDIADMLCSPGQNLEAFGRGRLDILQLHYLTEQQLGNDRFLRAVQQMKDEGFLMATGAFVYGESPALASIGFGVIDVVQIAFNLLDQRPRDAVFAEAQRNDVGLMTRSALLKGAMTQRWRALPPPLHELTRVVVHAVAAVGSTTKRCSKWSCDIVSAPTPRSGRCSSGCERHRTRPGDLRRESRRAGARSSLALRRMRHY